MTTNDYSSVLDEAARTIGALLWALYRHQGSNDAIEQGAREMLGIGPNDPMTDAQVAAAKQFGESIAWPAAASTPPAPVNETELKAQWDAALRPMKHFPEVGESRARFVEGWNSCASVVGRLRSLESEAILPAPVEARPGSLWVMKNGPLEAVPRASAAPVEAVKAKPIAWTTVMQIEAVEAFGGDGEMYAVSDEEANIPLFLHPATTDPAHPDDAAVDRFAARMKEKMAASRAKGRGGWETCPPDDLSRMLREHVEKGDPVDVANFCMMLSADGSGIDRADPGHEQATFQEDVQPWMIACFGPMIAGDREERNHRFLEESLELVQACGCTASEAHQLVGYVFGRPVGEPAQEAGGVMVTLAALCLANGLDMHVAGETELARIWTKVEQIRAKQAAKPKHSPLPVAPADPVQGVETWQPIETARPSLGRTLLLGFHNTAGKWRTVRGRWISQVEIDDEWDDPEDFTAGWYEIPSENDDEGTNWPISPTHWMPLPTAPAAPVSADGAADEGGAQS